MDDRQQESTNEGGSGGEATLPIPPPPAGSTQGPPSASQAGEKGAAETPRIRSTSGASEGSIDVSATPETGGGGGGAAEGFQQSAPQQVKIQLHAVGSAPMLKKTGFLIDAREPFVAVKPHLRKMLQLDASAPLFLYVNQSFSPGPDDKFGDLLRCFGTKVPTKSGVKEELILYYGIMESWG